MSKKETIYIDNQDDITAIIDKLKASSSSIVAIVPPKRSSVLESIVNIKLLSRMSKSSDKQLVLVTKDAKITSLAGAVGIHVAETLTSKPKVPEIAKISLDDDIEIDESDLDEEDVSVTASVGTLAAEHEESAEDADAATEQADSDSADKAKDKEPAKPVTAKTAAKPAKKKGGLSAGLKRSGIKIPNFETFRVRLFLAGGVLIALIVAVWWVLVVLPKGTIDIYAQTTPLETNFDFTADATRGVDDLESGAIAAIQQEVNKTVSQEFTPTGEKEVGESASGTLTVTNCENSTGVSLLGGSTVTHIDSGLNFIVQSDAFVPGSNFSGGGTVCDETGFADVAVTAAEPGTEHNVSAGSYSVSGLGLVTAIGSSMSGGTSETLTVVTQDDIDNALSKVLEANDDEVQAELSARYSEEMFVLNESFTKSHSGLNSVPDADEEATSAQITVTLNYSILGVSRSSLQALASQNQNQIIDNNKEIVDDGFDSASISLDSSASTDNVASLSFSTRAFIGPKLDLEAIKQEVAGKRFSETRSYIEAIDGVNRVEVDYSPFWVSNTPAANKVDIELVINERQ